MQNSIKELATMLAFGAALTPSFGNGSQRKGGIKKIIMPSKQYKKRKKALRASKKSKSINRKKAA